MQTSLHIAALVREARRELTGSTLVDTAFYRKERAAYLYFKAAKTRWALGLVWHPHGHGAFLVPAGKTRVSTGEKPFPLFGGIEGRLVAIEQRPLDRILTVTVEAGGSTAILALEAIGANSNIWLLDSDSKRQQVLRNRDFTPGEPYEPPPLPNKLNPIELEPDDLTSRVADHTSLLGLIEKDVHGFNRTLAKEALIRADLDFTPPDEIESDGWTDLAKSITDLARRFESPETGYLYDIGGKFEAYPFKLRSQTTEPEKLKTLSLAVLEIVSRKRAGVAEADEEKQTVSAVKRTVKRLAKRVEKLERDVAAAADFDSYRRIGELLQTHFTDLKKGLSEITLNDLMTGEPVTVSLDPKDSPADSVESYFRRYRKGKEGLEMLERRLAITRDELTSTERMLADLEVNFVQASQQYAADIAALLPRDAEGKGGDAPRLPYREHTLSTGLTIFIGRDGSDNDRTTFDFAKPYELWFHTQQCPGSHVVMKFPNKSFQPSKREIEETAAIAAWHSKARNDTLVPVIYAERRYVRKPRKAKPGLVTVEREKSVMVEPARPE